MTSISKKDVDFMSSIINVVSGNEQSIKYLDTPSPTVSGNPSVNDVLGTPGVPSPADIAAMSDLLKKLNSATNHVVDDMITASYNSPDATETLYTQKIPNGVKIGRYQVTIMEDQTRLAGKQYYQIYNSLTNTVLIEDISLIESAIQIIRALNSGNTISSEQVQNLIERDTAYTSHKIDAIMFKKKAASALSSKKEIFESRFQSSRDQCIAIRKQIRSKL